MLIAYPCSICCTARRLQLVLPRALMLASCTSMSSIQSGACRWRFDWAACSRGTGDKDGECSAVQLCWQQHCARQPGEGWCARACARYCLLTMHIAVVMVPVQNHTCHGAFFLCSQDTRLLQSRQSKVHS